MIEKGLSANQKETRWPMGLSENLTRKKIQIAQPDLGLEEWEALRRPIESGWLTQGPCVSEFEKLFAEYHQVPHALAVTSCTTGLHLALAALGVQPGDEVIVPAFTWVATANVVLYCGATPVFVDIDPITFNMDMAQVAAKLTSRTKAVIPVHLFGLCADIDALKQVIPDSVAIIEDAACATGAMYKGRMAGSLGTAGVFSFHPRKSITTGEGGMVTTCDAGLAERMTQLRNHGASVSEEQRHAGPKPYLLPDFNLLGFNYRMTDLQGAVGVVQFGKLERILAERRQWVRFYHERLRGIDWLRLPEEPEDGRHGWQAYVCTVDPGQAPLPRNEMMDALERHGVSTRPGTHAVHNLTYYREQFGYQREDFPVAMACDQNTLALPLHNRIGLEDYEYIVDLIRRF